jgi:GrpB-like predicted nucleotidyltransferase (UPF0157 family)
MKDLNSDGAHYDLQELAWEMAGRQRTGGALQSEARLPIGVYGVPAVVEYLPHNPEARRVAQALARLIAKRNAELQIEHIGSTAVPGCWGKGIIDLLVTYPAGSLRGARETLDCLGFQRQGGPEPFPESRPMRVGSFEYFGRSYRVHAHVIESGNAQAVNLLKFRDALRRDVDLRRAYEAEKRAILARGITQGTEYSKAKGNFIQRASATVPNVCEPPLLMSIK